MICKSNSVLFFFFLHNMPASMETGPEVRKTLHLIISKNSAPGTGASISQKRVTHQAVSSQWEHCGTHHLCTHCTNVDKTTVYLVDSLLHFS